jgi:hypothetical protein
MQRARLEPDGRNLGKPVSLQSKWRGQLWPLFDRIRLVFERPTDPPPEGFLEGLGSNHQRQSLKVSKHYHSR